RLPSSGWTRRRALLKSSGAPAACMGAALGSAEEALCQLAESRHRLCLPSEPCPCSPRRRGPQAGQCLRFWLMQPCSVVFPAEWLPRKAENLTPYTMALIAKYVARHRLREPRLLDTIANFLLKRGEQLESKVIQKLVFPFSRMNYRPSNHSELFPKLEAILEQKAASSPLATVNILMSMFQLRHFPQAVLHQVFSPAFITNVMSSPYALIVRRYLSLLDAALELEFRDYSGPRLDPRYRVLMFDHALTADEANRKYSYKGLVAEALRQLVGEECYRQDEVLPPGYCTDFLLWINRSGTVLPLAHVPAAYKVACARPGVPPAASCLRSSVLALTADLVVLSVNDKWHYCQNSDILVGSRAMRDRHLQLLGYSLVQVRGLEMGRLGWPRGPLSRLQELGGPCEALGLRSHPLLG
uniref:Fas activated serine/threonine kinase n=1 Tax=Chelydra serpentina TaxID=8475 RepID=A0A8C3XNM8_CHESE